MKKNIEYIALDSSLTDWLAEHLKEAPSSKDLARALRELAEGQHSALMLEMEDAAFQPRENAMHFGSLTIQPQTRRVMRDGTEIILTPKEFDILMVLARNPGIVFTKDQIYRAVWENEYLLDDSNIMAFIRKLRKKIEPNPDAPEYILTVWGIGYKFNDHF